MNSTNLDLSGHCRRFYSNNECNGCTKAHCHRTKRLVQKLQSLKLFFRVSSGYLLPREELKDFYTHINNNRICLNFYLFSECHERHSSGHQHIEMSTQKDKLKPEPIEAVTLGGPMVSDAYFQETMACDCKFCAKKREELGEEFGYSTIGNVSNSNEENHEKELKTEKEINSKKSIKTDKLIQRNEENTKNNYFEKDVNERKKKKNSEERSEESREKSEDEEKPQKKQKKTKKDKLKSTKKKQISSKKDDKNKRSKKNKEESESSEQNSSNQPSEDEEEEVKRNESQDEEEQEVCARCRQKGIICEFLPCNHRNFCMVCAEKIYREVNKKCSICLRKIELFKI